MSCAERGVCVSARIRNVRWSAKISSSILSAVSACPNGDRKAPESVEIQADVHRHRSSRVDEPGPCTEEITLARNTGDERILSGDLDGDGRQVDAGLRNRHVQTHVADVHVRGVLD